MVVDLFKLARTCLEEEDLERKLRRSLETTRLAESSTLEMVATETAAISAGRPEKPELVAPGSLARRGFGSPRSRLVLIHAIAHIEFNAINLAWDAICRFQDMPLAYYRDWLKIAEEETLHFMLLREYLHKHNQEYGDYNAHNGLWEMAEITADDVLERMAVVPRVLEARGLDVTPAMVDKFQASGETEAAEILSRIYKDEIGHVQIGSYWFRHVCRERGLDPETTFIGILKKFRLDNYSKALNTAARQEAGFSRSELEALKGQYEDNCKPG